MQDSEVSKIINNEKNFQNENLILIASDNYISESVSEALGSFLGNRYSEGAPHARYYQGQKNLDEIEELARSRALEMFKLSKDKWHVNVQPYSGSPANLVILMALAKPGDKIMGMSLSSGGHLTHGHKVSFSGKLFEVIQYGVDEKTGLFNYEEIEKQALTEKPKILICGASAYPRTIDFKKFSEIARKSGAYLVADISHIAGLIVGGAHPSPFPYADVVMTTTHKTLRGPRGAIIICKKDLTEKIDKAVFPGLQGGPHQNTIAAMAVAFGEALKPEFKEYGEQIVKNAKTLSNTLHRNGIKLITGGTDNHLILVDVTSLGLDGKKVAKALEKAGIIVNKNVIPGDKLSPQIASGIRLGTPAVTTRGMKEDEMKIIAELIIKILKNSEDEQANFEVGQKVKALTSKFPVI